MRNRNGSGLLPVFLLVGALCPAQAPQAATPAPDDKPASVEGVVTNALTGEPLLRAHVTLRTFAAGSPQNYGALTAADGKFSITGLPAGSYTASAERSEFAAVPDRSGRLSNTVVLKAGDRNADLKLKLMPTGAITGRVIDADGEPVESISVSAEGGSGMSINATTDDKGQFRLGGLAPGRYRIRASPMTNLPLPPEIRTDGTTETHYTRTYYPNAPDEKSAARLQVQAGAQVSGVEIHLLQTPIARVSGVVSGLRQARKTSCWR